MIILADIFSTEAKAALACLLYSSPISLTAERIAFLSAEAVTTKYSKYLLFHFYYLTHILYTDEFNFDSVAI